MWFKFCEGASAVSVALQHFTGDAKGYFEAGDHLQDTIVESGAAVPVGPYHPDYPPMAAEPTVIEGPQSVGVALGSTGPVNLPGGADQGADSPKRGAQ